MLRLARRQQAPLRAAASGYRAAPRARAAHRMFRGVVTTACVYRSRSPIALLSGTAIIKCAFGSANSLLLAAAVLAEAAVEVWQEDAYVSPNGDGE